MKNQEYQLNIPIYCNDMIHGKKQEAMNKEK